MKFATFGIVKNTAVKPAIHTGLETCIHVLFLISDIGQLPAVNSGSLPGCLNVARGMKSVSSSVINDMVAKPVIQNEGGSRFSLLQV